MLVDIRRIGIHISRHGNRVHSSILDSHFPSDITMYQLYFGDIVENEKEVGDESCVDLNWTCKLCIADD